MRPGLASRREVAGLWTWRLGLRWLVSGDGGAVTWHGFGGRSFGGGGCFRWPFTTVPLSGWEVAVLGGGSVAVELLLELASLDYDGLRLCRRCLVAAERRSRQAPRSWPRRVLTTGGRGSA